ncbi:MAG: glucosaminidase domain-containing protein [Acidimicrobiales bacterium]
MGQAVRSTSSDRPQPTAFGAPGWRAVVVGMLLVAALLAGSAMARPSKAGADPATTAPPATDPAPPADTTPPTDPAPPATLPTDAPAPTSPLADQTPLPPEVPLPDPSPQIRVALGRLGVIKGDRDVTLLTLAVTGAQQARDAADAAVVDAGRQVDDAQQALDGRRRQLGSLAAIAFMRAGGGTLGSLIEDDPTLATRQQGMFDASLEHQDRQVSDAQVVLDAATDALADARRHADDAAAALAASEAQLAAGQSMLTDAHAELAAAVTDESRPPSPTSWKLPIESASAFTADELTAWYLAGGHGSQASVPIDQLIAAFIDEGAAEGVRGDMAFAQSIHETGYFANSDTIGRNNFAGIGHCEACGGGFSFPSAQMGVRAQIQLLKSYAEVHPTYNSPRADPGLDGPAGCCTTWSDLTGVWASDPNYGPHILGGYLTMLEWLITYRPTEPLVPAVPDAPVASPVPAG